MKDRASVFWLAGAMLLLVFPIRSWIRYAPRDLLPRTVTPLDGSDPTAARQWLFLWQARTAVPPGATYTVTAPTSDAEMNLFMMSLGLLPEGLGLPTSYYGFRTPAGAHARYVLTYQGKPPPGRVRVRAVLRDGHVYERRETPK
jgi:hypothetical protein